jgi:hypothetical protein
MPQLYHKERNLSRVMTEQKADYRIQTKLMTQAKHAPEQQQVRDTFQTPKYAIDLLIPFIPKHITHVWECAAGGRKISGQLLKSGYMVLETDIKGAEGVEVHNFINDEPRTDIDPEKFSIITNPPFSIKELFINKCFEYGVPFALLINADYSGRQIALIKRGCEKIIPTSRISYITPNIIKRINDEEGTSFSSLEEIPQGLLYKYSSPQFHSMWLTYGYNLGRTETFVDIPIKERKNNI